MSYLVVLIVWGLGVSLIPMDNYKLKGAIIYFGLPVLCAIIGILRYGFH